MAKLGAGSLAQLATVHPDLQRVVRRVVARLPAHLDLKVIQGWRSSKEQAAAYASGASEKKPGASKHELSPSRAIDMALYPVRWKDEIMFGYLAGIVALCAAEEGVKVRWGGDWDTDGDTLEHALRDLDHWELV